MRRLVPHNERCQRVQLSDVRWLLHLRLKVCCFTARCSPASLRDLVVWDAPGRVEPEVSVL